jgi:hypothetical protein
VNEYISLYKDCVHFALAFPATQFEVVYSSAYGVTNPIIFNENFFPIIVYFMKKPRKLNTFSYFITEVLHKTYL